MHYRAQNPLFVENIGVRNLEVQIQDTTPPEFEVPSTIQALEAGVPFTDVGYSNLSDYDQNPSVSKKLLKQGIEYTFGLDDIFSTIEDIGFWDPDVYIISYEAIDEFNNSNEESYQINVVAEIEPHIALITSDFLSSGGL